MYNFGKCKCSVGGSLYPPTYYMERCKEEWDEFLWSVWAWYYGMDSFFHVLDELSDSSLLLSLYLYRRIGNRVYIALPFAKYSLMKGENRLAAHGCVRSERNKCS